MKITADTNVLVRAIVADDPRQARAAQAVLRDADLIAVPLPVLCETVWVLAQGYRIASAEIADAIEGLIESATVATNRAAVEAGLAVLRAGGDFADGVIAHEGRWLGAETFVSFDRQAVKLVQAQGAAATLLR